MLLAEQIIFSVEINDHIIIFYNRDRIIKENFYLSSSILKQLQNVSIGEKSIEEITIYKIDHNKYSIYYQIVNDDNLVFKTKKFIISENKVINILEKILVNPYVVSNNILTGVRFNSNNFRKVCIMDQHFRDYVMSQNNMLVFNINRLDQQAF